MSLYQRMYEYKWVILASFLGSLSLGLVVLDDLRLRHDLAISQVLVEAMAEPPPTACANDSACKDGWVCDGAIQYCIPAPIVFESKGK
jgi:hypothetical protein